MGHVATKSRANDPMSRLVSWVVKICLIVVVVDALVHRWFPLSREGVPSKANSKLTELTQEVRPGAEDKRAAAPDWETAAQPSSVADIDPRNGSEPWEVLPRRSDWEDGQIPAWCDKLMLEPRPWTATPGTPPELKRCGRRTDEGECFDGSPITFFSQHHQDAYIYLKHFKNLSRRGSYLDIAANEPIDISNTFFMDRCMGWKGVCAEANPRYFDGLSRLRSCNMVRTCVSDNNREATFRLSGAVGGLDATVKSARKPTDKNIKLRCKTLRQIAAEYGLTLVDFLSLDVEGNEMNVLKGWNPDKLQINVIMVESEKRDVHNFLVEAGYRRHIPNKVESGGGPGSEYELHFHMDRIYLHSSVTWGKPV